MKILVPSYRHLLHSFIMISWIVIFIHITLKHRAKENVSIEYGTFWTIILTLIRLVSLLALPQTLLNFIGLLIYETFPDKVKLKSTAQSSPVFFLRVVTRGLYPKLVEKTVSQNLETLLSVGCENFGIEGNLGNVSQFNGISIKNK